MRFYGLLLGALCTWRITSLFSTEDGPWDLLARWRRGLGDGMLRRLLGCFYCASLWFAAPVALLIGDGWREQLLLVPALSAGAIILDHLIRRLDTPAAPWYEHPPSGGSNGVLRSEGSESAGGDDR